MKMSRRAIERALCFTVGISASVGGGSVGLAEPTSAPSVRSPAALVAEMKSDQLALNDLLGKDHDPLKNPALKASAAPKLIPVLRRMSADLDQLVVDVPGLKDQVSGSQIQLLAMLSLLGDQDAADRIRALAASTDPEDAIHLQSEQLLENWYRADNTVAAQTPLVDHLEKLDQAHPDSVFLTLLTAQMSNEAASVDLKDRMVKIATDEMTNAAVAAVKRQIEARKQAGRELGWMANRNRMPS